MKKPQVIIIAGPTAVGKSALAIKIGQLFNGEIINADSIQCYQQFNIGSAKTTLAEMKGIKHHLVDCFHPLEAFNAFLFQRKALQLIKEIHQRQKTVIISGGTGLYLSALIKNYQFPGQKRNPLFADQYQKVTTAQLFTLLAKKAPDQAAAIAPANRQRLLRALEREATPVLATKPTDLPFIPLIIKLKMNNQEQLNAKINHRVDQMVEDGLFSEVKQLMKKYPQAKGLQAIGYKEIVTFLTKKFSKSRNYFFD